MPDHERLGRLRWLCRRGMKELDVLLEAFLAREQKALLDGGWPELEQLLKEEDDLLWQGVLAPEQCPRYPRLIHAIVQRT